MNKDRNAKQLSLLILAFLLLNFPLVGLFSKAGLLGGLPPLYVYIFSVWLLIIGLTAWLNRRPAASSKY